MLIECVNWYQHCEESDVIDAEIVMVPLAFS